MYLYYYAVTYILLTPVVSSQLFYPQIEFEPQLKLLMSILSDCYTAMFFEKSHTMMSYILQPIMFQNTYQVKVFENVYSHPDRIIGSVVSPKYFKCSTHIFYNLNDIGFLIQESVKSNPTYAIFIQNHHQAPDIEQFWNYNYYIDTKQFVVKNLNDIIFLCPYCDAHQEMKILANEEIIKLFSNINAHIQINMQNRRYPTDLRRHELLSKPESCHLLAKTKNMTRLTVKACMLLMLSRTFNFSLDSYREHEDQRWGIHTETNLAEFLENNENGIRNIVETSFVEEPWGFIVFKDNQIQAAKVFLTQTDITLWISLPVLYLGQRFSAVLSIYVAQSKTIRTGFIMVTFLAPGLYRKLKQVTLLRKHLSFHKFNKLIWALSLSTIVSYAFKGSLILFLTILIQPEFPTDLESLCNSSIAIITFESTTINSFTQPVIFKAITQRLTNSDESENFPVYLKKLQVQTKGMNYDSGKFWVDLFQSKLEVELNKTSFTEDFAVIDPLTSLKVIRRTVSQLIPSVWMSPIVLVDNFRHVKPIAMNRDYFYPMIKLGLGRFQESGLYNKWETLHADMHANQYLLTTQKTIAKLSRVAQKNPNIHAEYQPEMKPLKLFDLKFMWGLYLVAIISVDFVFLIERSSHLKMFLLEFDSHKGY